MQIKSIVATTAIALIAGVGSVSADENEVAGTAFTTGGTFALLDGIATEQMSIQEMAATRGAGDVSPILIRFLGVPQGIGPAATNIPPTAGGTLVSHLVTNVSISL